MPAAPQTRPRFTVAVWFYLTTFYVLFAFLPLILATKVGVPTLSKLWLASVLWPVIMVVAWFYANLRCSSAQLRFNDGMLWVAGSMMQGWLYLSFVTVLPMLSFAFAFSVVIALFGDIIRKPGYAQTRWHKFVGLCYRHRMRQV